MWIDSPFAAWAAVIALLFAFCLDRWFGEPVGRWHPVAWMRRYRGGAGTLAWWGGAGIAGLLAWLLQWTLLHLNEAIAGLLLGALLKPMLTWRVLRAELAEAGAALSPWLAGRLSDCVVAPVFWFMVAGLPGAVIYRFASTAGAADRWAARARDLLSWLPVRITVLLVAALGIALPAGNGAAPPEAVAGRTLRVADYAVAVLLAWTCLFIFLLSLRPW